MIKAVIFDLDGTLVQTEVLKATSYAQATRILTKGSVPEDKVLKVFESYVGLPREKVVEGLTIKFETEFKESLKTMDLQVVQQSLIEKRLELYQLMLTDEKLLSQHFCKYTMSLFFKLYNDNFKVVLATMSHLEQAKRVTTIMGIYDKFDLVLTKDDVKYGKPDPEIYLKAIDALGLQPKECLVIEDSVNGIRAAQRAGIPVFAVTNSVTRKSVHDCKLLNDAFVIDDLPKLTHNVYDFIGKSEVSKK